MTEVDSMARLVGMIQVKHKKNHFQPHVFDIANDRAGGLGIITSQDWNKVESLHRIRESFKEAMDILGGVYIALMLEL